MLDDLVARAAIVSSGRGAVFLPFLKTNPTEIILALQRDPDEKGEQNRTHQIFMQALEIVLNYTINSICSHTFQLSSLPFYQ